MITPQWIATRHLTIEGGGTLDVSIGVPEPTDQPPDSWKCPIRYVRNGEIEDNFGYGVDAFQALHNALGRMSLELECKHYTWFADYPGWANFPRIVAAEPGPRLDAMTKLYELIEKAKEQMQEEYLAKEKAEQGK